MVTGHGGGDVAIAPSPNSSSRLAVLRVSCQPSRTGVNSIGKLNLLGGLLAVVTLMVATTFPTSVSDHFRSTASNVSGRAPLSASALPNLSNAAASSPVANSTRLILSAPGTAGSDIRASTSVSACGAGSGEEAGAATGVVIVVAPGGSPAGGAAPFHPPNPNAAPTGVGGPREAG